MVRRDAINVILLLSSRKSVRFYTGDREYGIGIGIGNGIGMLVITEDAALWLRTAQHTR